MKHDDKDGQSLEQLTESVLSAGLFAKRGPEEQAVAKSWTDDVMVKSVEQNITDVEELKNILNSGDDSVERINKLLTELNYRNRALSHRLKDRLSKKINF